MRHTFRLSDSRVQRHSLDGANTCEHAVTLERENHWLKAEIAILRANPTTSKFSLQFDTGRTSATAYTFLETIREAYIDRRCLVDQNYRVSTSQCRSIESTCTTSSCKDSRMLMSSVREFKEGEKPLSKVRENELQWRLKSAEEEKKISPIGLNMLTWYDRWKPIWVWVWVSPRLWYLIVISW